MEHLKIEYIPIDRLKPYENNTRKHGEEDVSKIAQSIKQYGFSDPVGVWSDELIIVEGHGRIEAASKLGMKEVPCIRLDHLSDEQRKQYSIAHNRTAEFSSWDFEALEKELAELDFGDLELNFGIATKPLDESLDFEEDDFEEEETPHRAKQGDIFQLGKHRLMCGDSTNPEDIKKLMNGRKAKILFTSPPYSNLREYTGNDVSVDTIKKFISAYRPYTDYQVINLGLQFQNHEIFPYWDEYIAEAKLAGYKFLSWNIWDKLDVGSIGQQKHFFPTRHEWIFVFGTEPYELNFTWEKKDKSKRSIARKVRQADGSTRYSSIGDTSNEHKRMESVLAVNSECGKIRQKHPAVFPVALPAEYVQSMTKHDDIVIEPFGGSGTTMIACEQIDRACYMMEFAPEYMDVILQRWEEYTGEKAVLLDE